MDSVASSIAADVGVAASGVSVELSAGSVKVDVTIRDHSSSPDAIASEVSASTTFKSTLVTAVSQVPGLPLIGGGISVSDPQINVVPWDVKLSSLV